MSRQRTHVSRLADAFSVLALAMSPATAGQLPEEIKIVVPSPAGGVANVLAHALADAMARSTGTAAFVENKGGRRSDTGLEYIARAAPDGATLGLVSNAMVINPQMRAVDYEPSKSFAPLCRLVDRPYAIAVDAGRPYVTLHDFLAAARANPGRMSIAMQERSAAHLAAEQLRRASGADFAIKTTAGDMPAITMVLGGAVDAAIADPADVTPQVTVDAEGDVAIGRAAALRILATTGEKRALAAPRAPTLRELGYDIEQTAWLGLVAPAGVSNDVAASLVDVVSKAMETPHLRKRLEAIQTEAKPACGADFATFLRERSAEARMFAQALWASAK
jgi:tripartite-type tricarboxylate transporter receptor subunit TctC